MRHPGIEPERRIVGGWAWQLAFAVFGLAFLISPIAAAATGNWVVPLIVGALSIAILLVLERTIGPRRAGRRSR